MLLSFSLRLVESKFTLEENNKRVKEIMYGSLNEGNVIQFYLPEAG
jgi:hypothetical protein